MSNKVMIWWDTHHHALFQNLEGREMALDYEPEQVQAIAENTHWWEPCPKPHTSEIIILPCQQGLLSFKWSSRKEQQHGEHLTFKERNNRRNHTQLEKETDTLKGRRKTLFWIDWNIQVSKIFFKAVGRKAALSQLWCPNCPKMSGYAFLFSRVPLGETTVNSLKQEIPSASGYFSNTCFQGKSLGAVLTAFLHNSLPQPQTLILNWSISQTTQRMSATVLPEKMVLFTFLLDWNLSFNEPWNS